jgi:hypothetical protein
MLHEISHEVLAQGGRVHMSGVKRPLHEKLVAGGVTDLIGPEHLFPELSPAVDAAVAWVRGESAHVVTDVRTPAAW